MAKFEGLGAKNRGEDTISKPICVRLAAAAAANSLGEDKLLVFGSRRKANESKSKVPFAGPLQGRSFSLKENPLLLMRVAALLKNWRGPFVVRARIRSDAVRAAPAGGTRPRHANSRLKKPLRSLCASRLHHQPNKEPLCPDFVPNRLPTNSPLYFIIYETP